MNQCRYNRVRLSFYLYGMERKNNTLEVLDITEALSGDYTK